jgi:hypothetical protein
MTNETKVIYRVEVRRENNDRDVLIVCLSCLTTTRDFLRVVRKTKCPNTSVCDRCN